MRILNPVINGLAQAQESFDRAATEMERGTSETVGDGFIQEGDVVELSPAMVTMLSAQRGFQTALNVVHIEDEMDRALLDVLSKVQQQQ